MTFRRFLILTHCLLATTSINVYGGEHQEKFPDWFYRPSPGNAIGSIGVAYQLTLKKITPRELARIHALQGLLPFLNIREFDRLFAVIDGKQKSVQIGEQTIRISEAYETEQYVLIHASVKMTNADKPQDHQRVERECNPQNCSPSWLCQQNTKERAGFLGISYRASSLPRQFEIARLNALSLLEYTYGVEIKGKEEYYVYSNSVSVLRLRDIRTDVKKVTIDNNDKDQVRLYLKEQCFRGGTLFTWHVTDDIRPYTDTAINSKKWASRPEKLVVERGAVGHAGKSLFLSDQLQRAYENGLKALSQENVSISTEQQIVTGKTSSSYRENVSVQYKTRLTPRILGVYLNKEDDLFLWLDKWP